MPESVETQSQSKDLQTKLTEYYRAHEPEPPIGMAKIAALDTNECIGMLEVPPPNKDYYHLNRFEQSFEVWRAKQEGIKTGTLDGGIIGVGAGNIFTMLDVMAEIQADPTATPEFLIGIDIEPRAVLTGEVVRLLIMEVVDGNLTREGALKLLFGVKYWDEQARELLDIQEGDEEIYSLDKLEPYIRQALANQPQPVQEMFEELKSVEKTLDSFQFLRQEDEEYQPNPKLRSLDKVTDVNISNSNKPSLNIASCIYRNFDKLIDLAQRGDMHFVYGSIKDRQLLDILAAEYPTSKSKGNLLYTTNVFNIIERVSDTETSITGRRRDKTPLFNYDELEEVFNPSHDGVYVVTNSTYGKTATGRDYKSYELVATPQMPGTEFTEYYANKKPPF